MITRQCNCQRQSQGFTKIVVEAGAARVACYAMTLSIINVQKLNFIEHIQLAVSENLILCGCSICISRVMADFVRK